MSIMKDVNKNVTIVENKHCITTYADGIAFSAFCPDAPQAFKDKAIQLINGLTEEYKGVHGNVIADAELLISHNEHMQKCRYGLVAYICTEGTETESTKYEIVLGTSDYQELKKYALRKIGEHLFV